MMISPWCEFAQCLPPWAFGLLESPFLMMGHNPCWLDLCLRLCTNVVWWMVQVVWWSCNYGIRLVPDHFHSIFASCLPLSPTQNYVKLIRSILQIYIYFIHQEDLLLNCWHHKGLRKLASFWRGMLWVAQMAMALLRTARGSRTCVVHTTVAPFRYVTTVLKPWSFVLQSPTCWVRRCWQHSWHQERSLNFNLVKVATLIFIQLLEIIN